MLSLLAPIISYVGIFVGVLVGHMTFEELGEGKNYFGTASNVFIFLILATVSFFIGIFSSFWYVGLVLGLISLAVFKYPIPRFVVYLLSPLLYFLPQDFAFTSFSFLFLYSLCQGSLFVKNEKKWAFVEAFTRTHIFLIVYVFVIILSLLL